METQIKLPESLPTETFSFLKCKSLWEKDVDATYDYVNQFYFKLINPIGVIFWDASRRKFQFMSYPELKKHLPDLKKHLPIGQNTDKTYSIYLQKIWEEKTIPYTFEVNPFKPMFYEENGAFYINHFLGSPHNLDVKFNDMSEDVKNGVEFIWSHVKNILCGKDEKSFKYVHDWICNTVCFRRNKTALYIKSLQGVGKSIITDFIVDKVLTTNIAYRSGDSSILTTWNASLVGKVLFVLEELPCVSTHEWMKFSDSLKYLITGPSLKRKEKNEKDIDVNNYLNFVFLTNKTAIKVDDDDRRYVVLDVSIEKRGDFEYFNQLGKYVNSDEVALAFYRYCNEYVNHSFDPREIPETNSKNELIIDNLINVLVCIKEQFILRKKDLICKYSDFYKLYVEWCNSKHEKVKSKIEVARILNEHYIPTKNGTGNIKYCEMKYDDLLNLYQKQRWIHNTDEYMEDGDENFDFDSLDVQVEKPIVIKSVSSIEIQTEIQVKQTVDMETQTDFVEEITETSDPNFEDEKHIETVVENIIKPIRIDFDTHTLTEEEEVPIRRNKQPKTKPITIPKPVVVEHSEAEVKEALDKFHRMFSF